MDVVDRWTGRLAVALQQALRLTNEQFAEDLGCATRTIAKWHERPDATLSEASQQFLDCLLQRSGPEVRQRFALLARPADAMLRGVAPVRAPESDDDELMGAALESSAEVLLRSGHIGPEVLPELVQQVMRIARGYDAGSRMIAFRHARATRDLAFGLTTTTRRPKELTEFYLAAGQATALMASLAFDLGRWDASGTMARTAALCADMAGHGSLYAWALGLEATVDFWRGDGGRALDRLNAGLAVAPPGEPRFRLLHIAARAHAVRGDHDGVTAVLAAAAAERADVERPDDLHHEVGGEFAFDDARASACAGAAWLRLGDGVEAARYARRSLALADAPGGLTPPGVVCGARIDLAAALLLDGNLDEAADQLAPVLEREPQLGNVSLGGRLAVVRGNLRPQAGDPIAARLLDEVESWLAGAGIAVQQRK